MSRPPVEPPRSLLDGLQQRLGHPCGDRELRLRALTHPSFANESGTAIHNQRLEFLGDAVLNIVISTALFERFPERHEGKLSRLRSQLVCEETLVLRAQALDLGPCLRLGKGERLSGGRDKPSLLADAYEALLAAVYLDAGIEAARAVIMAAFEVTFVDILNDASGHDFKTHLQEIVQSRRGNVRPRYVIVDTCGPAHARIFTAAVKVGDEELGLGQGSSKKIAQQEAARDALDRLDRSADPPT